MLQREMPDLGWETVSQSLKGMRMENFEHYGEPHVLTALVQLIFLSPVLVKKTAVAGIEDRLVEGTRGQVRFCVAHAQHQDRHEHDLHQEEQMGEVRLLTERYQRRRHGKFHKTYQRRITKATTTVKPRLEMLCARNHDT